MILSYDLIIIGAPVYYERPLESILRLLENNKGCIQGRFFAIFVVCTIPNVLKRYAYRHYAGPLVERIREAGGNIVDVFLAPRWFRKPPKDAKDRVVK